jgi:hypothetical protein
VYFGRINYRITTESLTEKRLVLPQAQLADALGGPIQQAAQLPAWERRAFGRALYFDKLARGSHDQIQIDFGGIFAVVKIE